MSETCLKVPWADAERQTVGHIRRPNFTSSRIAAPKDSPKARRGCPCFPD